MWIIEAYVYIDNVGDFNFIMANKRKAIVKQEFEKLCSQYDGKFKTDTRFVVYENYPEGDESGFVIYERKLNTKQQIEQFLGIASKASHDTQN